MTDRIKYGSEKKSGKNRNFFEASDVSVSGFSGSVLPLRRRTETFRLKVKYFAKDELQPSSGIFFPPP